MPRLRTHSLKFAGSNPIPATRNNKQYRSVTGHTKNVTQATRANVRPSLVTLSVLVAPEMVLLMSKLLSLSLARLFMAWTGTGSRVRSD